MDAAELERLNAITQVAIELGIKVRGSVGECFQAGKHPPGEDGFSLFFNPARNTFFCRICSELGGGVIDLVCQVKNWKRGQAMDWLRHRVEFDQHTKRLYGGKGLKK